MKRLIDAKTEALALQMQLEGPLVRLSKVGKLGVYSWSLQALNTCPASIKSSGELVDSCKGCYAAFGQYNYPNVKAPREYNKWAWKQDNFVNEFVEILNASHKYFRWLDSGDLYSLALAEKVYEIMKATPETKHWLPTRMHKFDKFKDVLNRMAALPNVVVRLSSDSVVGDLVDKPEGLNIGTSSTIIPEQHLNDFEGKGQFICKAYYQEGKCKTCRACYDKNVETVAYVGHGKVLKSLQAKRIALTEV
ncbi:GP88 family protein (plasmid) [Acinetobacter baumannii]